MLSNDITFEWCGPYPFGRLDAGGIAARVTGVYILVLEYKTRLFAHYAGKSTRVGKRIHEHRKGLVNGQYWVHDLDETMRIGRLGHPLYNPLCQQSLVKGLSMQAQRWVDALSVYYAPVRDEHVQELRQIEAFLCYRFSAVPDDPCSAFFDHSFRRDRPRERHTVTIHSRFGAGVAVIEGLARAVVCLRGECPKYVP